jgi:hypothetical protein
MCPERQLLSIYLDGELPSPWKEKMESHLEQCGECKERLDTYRRFFNKEEQEQDFIDAAKERVWQNIHSHKIPQYRIIRVHHIWQRKIHIPLPAVAAAVIILVFLAVFWIRGANNPEPVSKVDMILPFDELPSLIPAADMNGIMQYLGADSGDVIILRLPESRNFTSQGEPAILRAADYSRRRP